MQIRYVRVEKHTRFTDEWARRNRGKAMLDESRTLLTEQNHKKHEASLERKKRKAELAEKNGEPELLQSVTVKTQENHAEKGNREFESVGLLEYQDNDTQKNKRKKDKTDEDNPFANHKPITEVLHDIYDKNIK